MTWGSTRRKGKVWQRRGTPPDTEGATPRMDGKRMLWRNRARCTFSTHNTHWQIGLYIYIILSNLFRFVSHLGARFSVSRLVPGCVLVRRVAQLKWSKQHHQHSTGDWMELTVAKRPGRCAVGQKSKTAPVRCTGESRTETLGVPDRPKSLSSKPADHMAQLAESWHPYGVTRVLSGCTRLGCSVGIGSNGFSLPNLGTASLPNPGRRACLRR